MVNKQDLLLEIIFNKMLDQQAIFIKPINKSYVIIINVYLFMNLK